jgi:hypothetical protein
MSFIGPAEERNIETSTGKTFKLFMTAQEGGYWVASVLYTRDGIVDAHHESKVAKEDAYLAAVNWVLANLDQQAVIDPL